MKKNFIPAAVVSAAVALVALGGLSSCNNNGKVSAEDSDSIVAAVEEVVAAMEQLEADDTVGMAKYDAAFFTNADNKADKASADKYAETASGLKYAVVAEGTGASPSATDNVTVHYTGRLTDGTVFDSSVTRGEPATFPLNRVIPGWTEGLQLMKEGGKTVFYLPSKIAYGEMGAPGAIPPNADLIFEVELIKVN